MGCPLTAHSQTPKNGEIKFDSCDNATERTVSQMDKMEMLKVMREVTSTSQLEQGREQISTEEIAGQALTLRDFDRVQYVDPETGKDVDYYITVFDELPKNFYRAGKQLSEMCNALENGGFKSALNEKGVLITLVQKKTKKGQAFTSVIILE